MEKTNQQKYDLFRTYYWDNAKLVGKYKFPQLIGTQSIPKEALSFNEINKLTVNDARWIDFFIYDYMFESFWKNPFKYFAKLRKAAGVIGTDFSMYPELLPAQNIWNCTRNRILCYLLQKNNFNVIPVASWCFESDFEWCFDGLPQKSSIAITSNGCSSSKYAMRIFIKGIEALYEHTKFSNLIVCGKPVKELDVEFKNVHYYPNFNERLRRRLKNGK